MFRENDTMPPEVTPERVLAICRSVQHTSLSAKELRKVMRLSDISTGEARGEIRENIRVASDDLDIIQVQDNRMVLRPKADMILSTSVTFRRYVSNRIFYLQDSTFVKFTRWYIAKNDMVFRYNGWKDVADAFQTEMKQLGSEKKSVQLGKNSLQGWRFWASFLGIGYLSGNVMIPNMKTRIQDILAEEYSKRFPYGEKIRVVPFLTWLSSYLPEVNIQTVECLPLAISAGLRTLHELGLIHMDNWQDSQPVKLYYVEGDLNNFFSHIQVFEEVCK